MKTKAKKHPNLRLYSYWNGYRFGWVEQFPWLAEMQGHNASSRTEIKWRGLSTNPEVKKPPNKRKTMYVVMNAVTNNPTASFFSVNSARDYAETVNFPVRVKRIRFRTSE